MKQPKPPGQRGPTAWRAEPRDEQGAPTPFPRKEDFIAHLRSTNRPTSKDLRILRARKKAPAVLEPE
jgi:hypothetical protein